jgi:hypothetical protein
MADPLGALSIGPAASTTNVEEDVDGGPPGGRYRWVRHRPPLRLKKMSMVTPLGALPAGLAVATTEVKENIDCRPLGALSAGPVASTTDVEEDVDGGPPRRCCRWVWQRPPLRLKKTSMAGPLGGAADGTGSGHH